MHIEIDDILVKIYGLHPISIIKHSHKKGNIFIVTTDNKTYILKVYSRPVNHDFQIAILNQLTKNGFTQFPRVIFTKNGQSSVEMGSLRYVLYEWIDGTIPSFHRIRQLKMAASFLASFHAVAEGLDEDVINKSTRNDFLYPATFGEVRVGPFRNKVILNRLNEWVNHFGTDPLRIALERMEYAENMFSTDNYKELLQTEKEKNTFIHGDYNYSNLIYSPKGKVYLIDFDASSVYMRICDLLFLCHLHMGKEAEYLIDILKSYHQIRPLSRLEFEIIKAELFVPGKIYWEMHINTHSNHPINEEWINNRLAIYALKERFDKIRTLSFKDIC